MSDRGLSIRSRSGGPLCRLTVSLSGRGPSTLLGPQEGHLLNKSSGPELVLPGTATRPSCHTNYTAVTSCRVTVRPRTRSVRGRCVPCHVSAANLSGMNTSHHTSGEHGPDILVVDTWGGTQPHLALLDDPYLTFCGVETSGPSRTWFALTGCKRCATSARKKGIAGIKDVDSDMCLI